MDEERGKGRRKAYRESELKLPEEFSGCPMKRESMMGRGNYVRKSLRVRFLKLSRSAMLSC